MKVQIKQKLYFTTWLYNYHLIINELAKQIKMKLHEITQVKGQIFLRSTQVVLLLEKDHLHI